MSILILVMPGISVGQCPSSYYGYLDNDDEYGGLCGFRVVSAFIGLNSLSTFHGFGEMNVDFSNNVKIYAAIPQQTYIENISFSNYSLFFRLAKACEPTDIDDDDELIKVIYTVLDNNTASAITDGTKLARSCVPPLLCTTSYEAADITINASSVELEGNIIAPGEFSCTGGNSTDNGLPNRFVTVSMADTPNWEICSGIQMNGYGYYNCESLREDCDYTICVTGPEDEYCGLSEFDIDIIRDLILGVICEFDYKWQHYAADVNNDGEINTEDIVKINRVLLDVTPYGIPYSWKYISNTQYDNYTPDCNDRVSVPSVYNCSEINMDDALVEEDWYGFPVGDLDHTCNSCGFRGNPTVYSRSTTQPISINLVRIDPKIIELSFNSKEPVSIWTLELKADFPVQDVIGLNVNSENADLFQWQINKSNNTIKMVYVNISNVDITNFKVILNLKQEIDANNVIFSFNYPIDRIQNIVIDKFKEYTFFESVNRLNDLRIKIYPNPAESILYCDNLNICNSNIKILDITGKLILSSTFRNCQLDISGLYCGFYFLQFCDGTSSDLFPIIKIK
ncbi:MAG: T9SS type A sorting domain-containing protein [Saprospiraceae bacterium]